MKGSVWQINEQVRVNGMLRCDSGAGSKRVVCPVAEVLTREAMSLRYKEG